MTEQTKVQSESVFGGDNLHEGLWSKLYEIESFSVLSDEADAGNNNHFTGAHEIVDDPGRGDRNSFESANAGVVGATELTQQPNILESDNASSGSSTIEVGADDPQNGIPTSHGLIGEGAVPFEESEVVDNDPGVGDSGDTLQAAPVNFQPSQIIGNNNEGHFFSATESVINTTVENVIINPSESVVEHGEHLTENITQLIDNSSSEVTEILEGNLGVITTAQTIVNSEIEALFQHIGPVTESIINFVDNSVTEVLEAVGDITNILEKPVGSVESVISSVINILENPIGSVEDVISSTTNILNGTESITEVVTETLPSFGSIQLDVDLDVAVTNPLQDLSSIEDTLDVFGEVELTVGDTTLGVDTDEIVSDIEAVQQVEATVDQTTDDVVNLAESVPVVEGLLSELSETSTIDTAEINLDSTTVLDGESPGVIVNENTIASTLDGDLVSDSESILEDTILSSEGITEGDLIGIGENEITNTNVVDLSEDSESLIESVVTTGEETLLEGNDVSGLSTDLFSSGIEEETSSTDTSSPSAVEDTSSLLSLGDDGSTTEAITEADALYETVAMLNDDSSESTLVEELNDTTGIDGSSVGELAAILDEGDGGFGGLL